MTEEEILHIHEMLYQYLMFLRQEGFSLCFKLTTEPKNLEKGFWFRQHTWEWRKPLETLFWLDWNNTYVIGTLGLEYDFNSKSLTWDLMHRDIHEQHLQNFEKIKSQLTNLNGSSIQGNIWYKKIIRQNPLEGFREFIFKYKPLINNILRNNPYPIKTTIKDPFFKKEVALVESYRKKLAGRYNYKSIYSEYLDACKAEIEVQKMLKKATPKLSFAFTRLYVNDFQGIKKMVIDTISPDVQWIFLTGENGYGKTSILRAIATGFIGDEAIMSDLLIKSKIYINGISQNETFIYEPQPKTKSPISIPIVAYGITRSQLSSSNRDTMENSKKSVTYSLFKEDGQLMNIEQELINANAYNPPRFQYLVKILTTIIPHLAEIKVISTNGDPQIQYSEQNEDGKRYPPVPLEALAAGYRSILTMIGDMMIRLSKYPNNSLENLQGIVLIDEIDAHLHPKYQFELPKLLSDAFPKVQFIVTTHSPIPLLGLPEKVKSVVLKVNRTIQEGITVNRLDDDIEIRRLSANALLTSDIFGFDNIFARDATPDTIEPFDDYKKIEAKNNIELELELRNGLKGFNIKI